MSREHQQWTRAIEVGAQAMGLALDGADVTRLVRHLELLSDQTREFNLTAVDSGDYVVSHVLDSLSAASIVLDAPRGPMADLGAGAGFPGIPLAIATGRHVDLVESSKKKAAFLEAVCVELRLDATIHGLRAEEVALTHPEYFAVAVARALTALPSLVELASPLLVRGGVLVCLKGSPTAEELDSGKSAAGIVGMRETGCPQVRVPGMDAQRTLVIYEKVGPPEVRLPRRPGMAQKRPLA